MNTLKFIIRSIVYYRRQHLGLFLGMTITATVLTGALIIGDSIQFSLEKMVENRLGKTTVVVSGGSRFVDTGLAAKLANKIQVPVSPVLMLRGIAVNPSSGERLNQAFVLGIDSTFNGIAEVPLPGLSDDEAIINTALSERLGLKTGDNMILRVQSASVIPVNAPFSREPVPTVAIRLTVKAIAGADQAGMFNLANSQSAAYNVFVSRDFLGKEMNLGGLSNVILIAGEQEKAASSAFEYSMQQVWSIKDMGLFVKRYPEKGIYDLVSNRIFIDTIVQHTASRNNIPYEEIVTYLINDIAANENHTPYSFASGVSSALSGYNPAENELIVNNWIADDLNAKPGDSVVLTYYEIGPLRRLYETSQGFRIKEITRISGRIDSSLMPRFPGLSEAGNCRDWDAGVPIDMKRIRDKDEEYWDDYRGTPKVLLSLEKAKEMWKNSFGSVTALRFQESLVPEYTLKSILLRNIRPSDIGIRVINVRDAGMNAAENAVNFTELFLGMSFFVIAAGLLLTILIYSLHFSRRSSETALLNGLGLSRHKIVMVRVSESFLVIFAGALTGALLGILYNRALIAAINTIWNDMVRTDMLSVHVKSGTLFTGALISMIFAVIPVYIVTVQRLRQSVNTGIKGVSDRLSTGNRRLVFYAGLTMLALSFMLVTISLVSRTTGNAALYLFSGALSLSGALVISKYITAKSLLSSSTGLPSIKRIAISNLVRNSGRSMAVIALLAIGTFTVVLTGAYRKTFHGSESDRKSGTGGYLLWAETISPVLFDLNNSEGNDRMLDDSNYLDGVRFLQFEKLDGDDASCLNLNQAQQPGILAVNPAEFDSTGAFTFARLPGSSGERWKILDNYINDSIFPAFADETVLKYSLKKKVGDTLFYMSESGKKIGLLLTASLDNSIFQGNILISNKVFRNHFPSTGGSRVILADGPAEKIEAVSAVLSNSLTDYGIDVIPAGRRLATFNSVENTYLSVFMVLSGLGLIIGTIGLGIILLRNIHERQKELALMLAIGYNRNQLLRLVFTENLYLLAAGWGIGIFSAFIGILPSLISSSFNLESGFVIILSIAIFVSGLIWIYFPLRSSLKKPLITALRND